jgi:hypothetical protein
MCPEALVTGGSLCPSVACMFCVLLLCVCVGEWPWWCLCQRGTYVCFSVCVSGGSWVCGGEQRGRVRVSCFFCTRSRPGLEHVGCIRCTCVAVTFVLILCPHPVPRVHACISVCGTSACVHICVACRIQLLALSQACFFVCVIWPIASNPGSRSQRLLWPKYGIGKWLEVGNDICFLMRACFSNPG